MNYIYVVNGVVSSKVHIPDYNQSNIIPSGPVNSILYTVSDATEVNVGWTCTLSEEGPVFAPSSSSYTTCVMQAVLWYNSFTVAESIAIKSSRDPVVQEFYFRLNQLITANLNVDTSSNSVQEGVNYLATTNQIPVTTPPSTYISPSRVADILLGVSQ
jgi:hypothetical protein